MLATICPEQAILYHDSRHLARGVIFILIFRKETL
nr:MAG TPA: hypothetical protein [Caudoviricetes sp.]